MKMGARSARFDKPLIRDSIPAEPRLLHVEPDLVGLYLSNGGDHGNGSFGAE